MQELRESLREAVSQGLCQNRIVVVMVPLEPRAEFGQSLARRHGEASEKIGQPARLWGDKIREGMIEFPGRLVHLLPEGVKRRQNFVASGGGIQLDVVSH